MLLNIMTIDLRSGDTISDELSQKEPKTPSVWAWIKEDYKRYRGEVNRPGFKALFMQRIGADRLNRSFFMRKLMGVFYRYAHRYVRNHYGIEIHDTTQVGHGVMIGHQGGIVIHEYAKIGDRVVLRQNVTIGAAGEWHKDKAPVIEDDVDIGAGAVIIGKVVVGKGAKIGPNAVVMTDIPPGALVMAPPPRVMKFPAKKSEGESNT